jgi:hypothetical protein
MAATDGASAMVGQHPRCALRGLLLRASGHEVLHHAVPPQAGAGRLVPVDTPATPGDIRVAGGIPATCRPISRWYTAMGLRPAHTCLSPGPPCLGSPGSVRRNRASAAGPPRRRWAAPVGAVWRLGHGPPCARAARRFPEPTTPTPTTCCRPHAAARPADARSGCPTSPPAAAPAAPSPCPSLPVCEIVFDWVGLGPRVSRLARTWGLADAVDTSAARRWRELLLILVCSAARAHHARYRLGRGKRRRPTAHTW